jgi:peptidoglycan/LPS O-acetylase OafA/YrhL
MPLIPTSDTLNSPDRVSFPYYNLLDGLRGFAILAVLYAHSSLPEIVQKKLHLGDGGFIGVDIFFVLSSFLISSLLIKEYLNNGRISIKSFYIRRILRLTPPLLAALVIFLPFITAINWKIAVKDIFYTLTYTANIPMSLQALIPKEIMPGYFYHTWSLATEEQFYLIFPVALLFIINKKTTFFANNLRIILLVIAIFVTAPILKPLLKDGVYTFPLLRIGEFLIGFLTALVYANILWKDKILNKTSFLVLSKDFLEKMINIVNSPIVSFCSFATFFGFIFFTTPHSWFVVSVGHLLISIVTACLILQITLRPNKVVRYFLGHRSMVSIGLISYGLYIYHLPIMLIEKWFFTEKQSISQALSLVDPLAKGISIIGQNLLYISLSFIIAIVSYQFLEKPIMKYKNKLSRS